MSFDVHTQPLAERSWIGQDQCVGVICGWVIGQRSEAPAQEAHVEPLALASLAVILPNEGGVANTNVIGREIRHALLGQVRGNCRSRKVPGVLADEKRASDTPLGARVV